MQRQMRYDNGWAIAVVMDRFLFATIVTTGGTVDVAVNIDVG